ncbi:hypothetical protein [uncultured Tateyamaria sp.]|uniref:hypothetical protein n=1 Tax=uncultured Tateyamaria sp. TaxID=455651 RepID=UPI002610D1B9|nr:hypothetical protein [uncultured Tateyamaria sp.]
MSLKMTKAPFAIAAIAAAITLTSASLAKAEALVIQAPLHGAEVAQVEQVGFKIKKHGVRHHHGFKHRSFRHHGVKRHHRFHHRSFRHHRGFKHRGFVHHPKSRSRIIIKKKF